jgi:hypothetical protein
MTRQRMQVSRRWARDAWRVPDLPSSLAQPSFTVTASGRSRLPVWWGRGGGRLPGKERLLSFHCDGGGENAYPRGEDRVDCGGSGEKGGRSAGVDCWRRGVLALMAGRV